MQARHLLSALFLIPLSLFASLTGTYEASGFDPSKGCYTGRVEIAETGDCVYSIHWDLDDGSVYDGTGVQQGKHLSFVYEGGMLVGVQSYITCCVKGNYRLEGPFVSFGSADKGYEKLKQIK